MTFLSYRIIAIMNQLLLRYYGVDAGERIRMKCNITTSNFLRMNHVMYDLQIMQGFLFALLDEFVS